MCAKKGFIFTLDITFGIIIVFLLVIAGMFFVSQASPKNLSEYQMLRTGSNIVSVMDKQGLFAQPDYQVLQSHLDELVPGNYQMLLRLQGNFTTGNGTMEIGSEIPPKVSLISGQRVSVTDNWQYLRITYFIWGRQT